MRHALPLAILTLVLAAPALAKDDEPPRTPQVVQDVVDCKAVTDPAARLACYDAKVAVMATGIEKRELVVADREMLRDAQRGLFGISVPKIKLFGAGGQEELKEIESTITAVRSANDGMPIFILADSSRWKQVDGRNVFAKPGNPVRIKRMPMGGFMANVDGQSGVRVVRLVN
jgi:hypothetical protein